MLRIAEMMMKKMMMLQVSPISLSFVSHKTIVAYLPNETEGKKKKCCPLFTTSSTVLLPHLRESTLFFFFFFPEDHFDDVSYFNTKASVDPRFSWVCAVTRVCVTSNMLFIRYQPTGQKQV